VITPTSAFVVSVFNLIFALALVGLCLTKLLSRSIENEAITANIGEYFKELDCLNTSLYIFFKLMLSNWRGRVSSSGAKQNATLTWFIPLLAMRPKFSEPWSRGQTFGLAS